MNKFFLFLAFASFALVACSDDKKSSPSHEELCAKTPITKECLVGKYSLQNVIETIDGFNSECFDSNHPGSLELKANGDYSFSGGLNSLETIGKWELNGTGMLIKCTIGNCTEGFENVTIATTFEVQSSELKVTSNDAGKTSFSQCKLGGNSTSKKLTEVFSYTGS